MDSECFSINSRPSLSDIVQPCQTRRVQDPRLHVPKTGGLMTAAAVSLAVEQLCMIFWNAALTHHCTSSYRASFTRHHIRAYIHINATAHTSSAHHRIHGTLSHQVPHTSALPHLHDLASSHLDLPPHLPTTLALHITLAWCSIQLLLSTTLMHA